MSASNVPDLVWYSKDGDDMPPLIAPRTVYVDSVTGSDTNPGTQAQPFRTLARAWADRQNYGTLLATYTVQLVGLGPYELPPMGPSLAGEGGYFVLLGDSSVDQVLVTSTFTGGIANYEVGTQPVLAIDAYEGDFVTITSGPLAGARTQLAANANADVTIAYPSAWNTLGDTANGNGFQIRRPRTQLVVPASTPTTRPGPNGWQGELSGLLAQPRHVIANVRITGAAWLPSTSAIALAGVRVEADLTAFDCVLHAGLDVPELVGAAECAAWGFQLLGSYFGAGVRLFALAIYVAAPFSAGTAGCLDSVILGGGRIAASTLFFVVGAASKFELYGSGFLSVQATMFAQDNAAIVFLLTSGIVDFDVSTGDCLFALRGGIASIDTTSYPFGGAVQGGTSDPVGLGCNAKGGGRIYWASQTPTLTGGTPGADIGVGSATAANATLAADGDGLADPDTLSCVARETIF